MPSSAPLNHAEETMPKPKIQHYLERILASGLYLLIFPRHLEHRFQRYYSERYRHYMQTVVFAGIMMIFCIGMLDIALVDKKHLHYSFRFMAMTPILGLGILFTFTRYYHYNEQATTLVLTILMAVTMLGLTYIQPQAFKDVYINGVLMIVLFLFAISRLQFWYSMIAGIVIAMNYHFSLLINHTFLSYRFIAYSYLYVCALVLALLANYLMEKSIRKQYLQNRLLSIEKIKLAKVNKQLSYLVNLDGLTGIANRRHFKQALHSEWQRAERYHYPLALLMIDVDHFKAYNDTYGHLAGDGCLRQVAQTIKQHVNRQGDLLARFGGDEFVLLLVGCALADAYHLAQKIHQSVLNLNIPNQNSPAKDSVTCTIGLSGFFPNKDLAPDDLIDQADQALYVAKDLGRNQVKVYNPNDAALTTAKHLAR